MSFRAMLGRVLQWRSYQRAVARARIFRHWERVRRRGRALRTWAKAIAQSFSTASPQRFELIPETAKIRPLLFEALEPRILLAADPLQITAIEINESDPQRSTVTAITVEFDQDVGTVPPQILFLQNTTTGTEVNTANAQVTYDAATHRATWSFPTEVGGTLADGSYVGAILADRVKSETGLDLDGNADGQSGDSRVFQFHRLAGDADGDRDNDFLDLFKFRSTFQKVSSDTGFDGHFDFDADGDVDFSDLFRFRTSFSTALEAAPTLTGSLSRDTAPGNALNADGLTFDPAMAGLMVNRSAVSKLRAGFDFTNPASYVDVTHTVLADDSFALGLTELNTIAGGTLTDGHHVLHLRAENASGGLLTFFDIAFELDRMIQTPAFNLALTSDSGIVGDLETSAARANLTGETEAGATLVLLPGNSSTLSGLGGTFQFTDVALNDGANLLSVTATDKAGNTSSSNQTITRSGTITADAALTWNQQALEAIRRAVSRPTEATRVLALVSLAQYDIVAAIEGTPAYLVQKTVSEPITPDAALAQAAHTVLSALFPAQRPIFDEALNAQLALIANGAAKTNGIALGTEIAQSILLIRSNDGAADFVDYPASTAVGQWRPTAPMFDVAEEPQWADVTPFALNTPDQFRPAAPPALDSAAYGEAVEEIRSLGSATSNTRTAEQTQMAHFWGDGKGSSTPAGHWNQIAQQVALAQGNSLTTNVRLLAKLNVALADAAIAAWDAKFTYGLWRPIDAIHDAELDNNPVTIEDESWTPLLITPFHPEYVSGHSTFSRAAATVLAATFGDNTVFQSNAFTLPGVTRSYTSFTQAAEEAGRSRVYGGIHYEFSNQAGQVLGSQIGNVVLERFELTQDTQAPSIIADDAPETANANITLTGQILDNLSGVESAQVRIDANPFTPLTLDAQGRFTITTAFALDQTHDGSHTITIEATDAAGNTSSPFTRSFTLDTRAPTIDLTSLLEGAELTGTSRLTGTADPTGSTLTVLSYRLDIGVVHNVIFANQTGTFDDALPLGDLSIGDHTLTLTARDAAGNEATVSRNVTLSEAAPFTITGVTPAQGASDIGVTYRPQVSFSRGVDKTTLTDNSLFATGTDGQKINATIVPALDGTFAWLFFDDPLPGASTITLHVDGNLVKAASDNKALDADLDGADGGTHASTFTTVSRVSVPNTTVVGRVVDPGPDLEPMTFDDILRGPDGVIHTADDVFLFPIANAKVFILGLESNAVFTDANGFFRFDQVPGGNVKLAIDGRTATNAPAGFFYPEMVMDLAVEAGHDNSVMGSMGTRDEMEANEDRQEVYLPRLQTSILKTVSDIAVTRVGVDPAAAPNLTAQERDLLVLEVLPGTLIGEDGNVISGGQVGISTVPPELVREMLPPGVLQHTFDITIQARDASGNAIAAFAQPLEITFPNVFDAPPGTKLNFLSFDHTTGRLVIEGTATVSADGLSATTDPGQGITKAGWHGLIPRGIRLLGGLLPPLTFLESNNPVPDPEGDQHPEPAPGDDTTTTLIDESFQPPQPVPGVPPELQPYLLINISVDGAVERYLKATEGSILPVTGGSYAIRVGDPVGKFSVVNLSLSEVVGPWGKGIENFESNVLYANKFRISKTLVEPYKNPSNPPRVTTEQNFYTERFIDATDNNADDFHIGFSATLKDGVQRTKSIQIIAGSESALNVPPVSAKGFVVNDSSGGLTITFDPDGVGSFSGQLSFLAAGKNPPPRSIGFSGVGTDSQHVLIDADSFERELAKLQALAPLDSEFTRDELDLFDTRSERDALIQRVADQVADLFMRFSPGIDVSLVHSPGPTVNSVIVRAAPLTSSDEGKYGGYLGQAYEVDFNDALVAWLDVFGREHRSKAQQEFILDSAINLRPAGAVDHDPADLSFFTSALFDVDPDDLVSAWATNIAHEVGHTLGLPHTYKTVSITGVAVPRRWILTEGTLLSSRDVMAQGIDFDFGHDFTRITTGALSMALDLAYSRADFSHAVEYYLSHVGDPFNAVSPAELADTDIVPFTPFLTARGVLFDTALGGAVTGTVAIGSVVDDGQGGQKATRQLRLVNLGLPALTISRLVIEGGSGPLHVSGLNSGDSIGFGESRTITIEYDPVAVENRTASVRIESNDPTGPFEFSVIAQSESPFAHAFLSVLRNNAGGAAVGSERVESDGYKLTNRGGTPLLLNGLTQIEGQGTFSIEGLPFDLSSNPVVLAPGESLSISYRFRATTQGLERGTFLLQTNDALQPVIRLTFSGTGLESNVAVHEGNDYVLLDTTTANGAQLRAVSDRGGNFEFVAPDNAAYELSIFDPVSGLIAKGIGVTSASGRSFDPTDNLAFAASRAADTDGDGLPDDIESTIGTALNAVDTDGDGIDDFNEIKLGLTPLDGRAGVTGVLSAVNLQGEAKAVVLEGSLAAAEQQTAYIATGTYGLAIVDASTPATPIVLAQLDLPGNAVDVSIDSGLRITALAAGAGGLHFVNVAMASSPVLLQTLPVNATHVEVFEGIAYTAVGAEIRAYDLLTGEKRATFAAGTPIVGLAREGQTLYVIDFGRSLRALSIANGTIAQRGTLALSGTPAKLFVGGGVAYIGMSDSRVQGFITVNVANPDTLSLISGADDPTVATASLAATGSGVLVTTGQIVGPTSLINAVDVMSVSDLANTGGRITRFILPQAPFDIAIGAGIAFVADGTGDLQIVNYLSADTSGAAPTVDADLQSLDLDPATPGIQVLEGSSVALTVAITDNVQVRNVELLRDGQVVINDVAFPFEMRTALPTLAQNGSEQVTLQVRATDTGGNIGLSAPVTVTIVPDTFGPTLVASSLAEGAVVGRSFRAVTLTFSEALDEAVFGIGTVQLIDAGGASIAALNVQFRQDGKQVQVTFAEQAVGNYALRINATQVRDRAGNVLGAAPLETHFTIRQFSVEWIAEAGGNWNTPGNWSTGAAPTATDDVFIGATTSPVAISAGNVTIQSLISNAALTLAGGTLSVATESQVNGSFVQSGGTLTGAGTLVLNGAGNAIGGAIRGAGTVILNGATSIGAGLVLDGGRVLENNSTLTWTGGTIELNDNAQAGAGTINNAVGATWIDSGTANRTMRSTFGSGADNALAAFNNLGTYTKSSTGTTNIGANFNNPSVLNVDAGILDFFAFTNTHGAASTVSVAAGAILNVSDGTQVLNGGVVDVSGTLRMNDSFGVLNVAADQAIDGTGSFVLAHGTLRGTTTLTVNTIATISFVVMRDAGTTVLNAATTVSGSGFVMDGGRVLENNSTLTWTGGTIELNDNNQAGAGTINNAVGATWIDSGTANRTMRSTFGSGADNALAAFNNFGTYTKSSTGTTNIGANFNNPSALNVDAGILDFFAFTNTHGAASTISVAAGAILNVSDGTQVLNGGAVDVSGTLRMNDSFGVLNVAADQAIDGTGSFVLAHGTLRGTTTLTVNTIATISFVVMRDAGTTVLNAATTVSGSGFVMDGGRVLENNSTLTWTGGTIELNDNNQAGAGTINNAVGATWIDSGAANRTMRSTFGSGADNALAAFNNLGTYTKSSTGTTNIGANFNNPSVLNVDAGILDFFAFTSTHGAASTVSVAAGAILNVSDGTQVLNGGAVDVSGTLRMNDSFGVLNVAADQAIDGTGSFVLAHGTLRGTTTLTVNTIATISFVVMRDAGTTVLNAATTVSGSGFVMDGGRVLENNSTLTWTGGTIELNDNNQAGAGTINNAVGATWIDSGTANRTMRSTFGSGADNALAAFNNFGTYTKSSTGTTNIGANFNNPSALNVDAGILDFFAFTNTHGAASTISVAAGAILNVSDGTQVLNGGAVDVSGTLRMNDSFGVLNVAADQAIDGTGSFVLAHGTLRGTTTLTVNTIATISFVVMRDAGTTVLNAATTVSGSGFVMDGGRVLENNSTLTWTGGTIELNDNNQAGAGTINNAVGATWIDSGAANRTMRSTFGSGADNALAAFNNLGTYTKSSTGQTQISNAFTNSGALNVNAGTLFANSALQSSGAIRINAGATVAVTGNYTQGSTAALTIEIGGLATNQFGRMTITGIADLNGTLNVLLVNGFTPALSNRFQFMTFASRSGFFSATTGLEIGGGLAFAVDQSDPKDLELVVL